MVTKLPGLLSGNSGLFGTWKVLTWGVFTYGDGGAVELARVVSAMFGLLVTPGSTRWLSVTLTSVATSGFSVVGTMSLETFCWGSVLAVTVGVVMGVLVMGRVTSVASSRDAGVLVSFEFSSPATPGLSVDVETSAERTPNAFVLSVFSTGVTISFVPVKPDGVSELSVDPVVVSNEAGSVAPLVTDVDGGTSVEDFGPAAEVSVSNGCVTPVSFKNWVVMSAVENFVTGGLSVVNGSVAPATLTDLGVVSVTSP